jgi:hypothetical protein
MIVFHGIDPLEIHVYQVILELSLLDPIVHYLCIGLALHLNAIPSRILFRTQWSSIIISNKARGVHV